jgi:hypothetical protein
MYACMHSFPDVGLCATSLCVRIPLRKETLRDKKRVAIPLSGWSRGGDGRGASSSLLQLPVMRRRKRRRRVAHRRESGPALLFSVNP